MSDEKRIETHPTMPIPRVEPKSYRRMPSGELNATNARLVEAPPPAIVEEIVRAQEGADVSGDRPTLVPCPVCSRCPFCQNESCVAQHVVTEARAVAIEDELADSFGPKKAGT